jgi:hypothetical protein
MTGQLACLEYYRVEYSATDGSGKTSNWLTSADNPSEAEVVARASCDRMGWVFNGVISVQKEYEYEGG